MSVLDDEINILEQRFNRLKREDFFSESMAFPEMKPKPKLLNDFMAQHVVQDPDVKYKTNLQYKEILE